MKKVVLNIIALAITLPSFAQWLPQPSVPGNYYLISGNVGIGLTNPNSPLEVVGTIVARNNATTPVNNVSINAGNTTTPGSSNVNRLRIGGNDANTGYFTIQGSSNVDFLTINNSNVGIGTTTPSARADIMGATSDANSYAFAVHNSSATSLFSVRNDGRIDLPGSGIWTATGNLGIGLTNPTNPLEVVGGIVARNSATPTVNSISLNAGNTNTAGSSNVNRLRIGGNDSNSGYFTIQGPGNTDYLTIYNNNIGIGTTTPDAKLAVKGIIHTQEVKVDMNGWSDYVFDKDYKLTSLCDLKDYVAKNHHLPEIPSETEVVKNGLNLGEMVKLQTKKIEELTLYLIEKNNQIESLQKQIDQLAKKINN